MSGSSTTGNLLLALLIALVGIGLYLAIDANSIAMKQSAETAKILRNVADQVDRLRGRLDALDGRLAAGVAVAGGMGAAANGADTPAAPRFANDDQRDPEAEAGDARVGYTETLPGQLNYLLNNETNIGAIWDYCLAPLAERNNVDVDRFEPVVAESWTISDDQKVFTIRLREGFSWHPFTDPATGKEWPAVPLTAHDYEFYWQVIQNPDVPCVFIRGYYEMVESLTAVDARTLRVVWREPYAFADSYTLGMQPLPRHLYRPDDEAGLDDKTWAERFIASPRNQMLVGIGPYRLASYDAAKGYRLERDESYGGRKPYLKVLETRVVGDAEIALVEFKNERLDSIALMPAQWRDQTPAPDFLLVTPDIAAAPAAAAAHDRAKADGTAPAGHRFEKYQYPGTVWSYIGYNLRRPLFADKRTRQALTMLVDRERILREVGLGLGQIISGPFVPQSRAYNHDIAPWPFDPAAAKARLAEAGWTDGDGDGVLDKEMDGRRTPFEFTFIIPSAGVTARKVAAIVEQDFKAAGIAVNIKPLEWSVYTDVLRDWDFDVCCLAWSGGLNSDPYQIWHGSGADEKGSSNHVGYRSAEADALIEKARRIMDPEERNRLYHRFHGILHEDQPYTFLTAGTATRAVSKRYRNLQVYPGGMDVTLHWVPLASQKALP